MQILRAGNRLIECCELVKVRCKEAERPDVRSDVSIQEWGSARAKS